jgi:hypothetical protein
MTSDLTPRYTPEVKRAADAIRKIVRDLTLTELIALRESLSGDWPIDPMVGVREPREPKPESGAGAATIDPEEEA